MKKLTMLLLMATLMFTLSCDTNETLEKKKKMAKTEEKQQAIATIQEQWQKAEQDDKIALKGADLVLKAKHNVKGVTEIIVLALNQKDGEDDHKKDQLIQLATYAAKAHIEIHYFSHYARPILIDNKGKSILKLAKKHSQAKTPGEAMKIIKEWSKKNLNPDGSFK